MADSDGRGAPYESAPAPTRPWAERHTGKTAVALLVVPLAIRSALVSAGVSEDAADLVQIIVGGAALAVFAGIIIRSRRRTDAV